MNNQFAHKLLIRGSGLQREIDGAMTAVGVYATIFVAEGDRDRAARVAIDEVRRRLLAVNAITARTQIEIESIEPVDPRAIPSVPPGMAFFRE